MSEEKCKDVCHQCMNELSEDNNPRGLIRKLHMFDRNFQSGSIIDDC